MALYKSIYLLTYLSTRQQNAVTATTIWLIAALRQLRLNTIDHHRNRYHHHQQQQQHVIVTGDD